MDVDLYLLDPCRRADVGVTDAAVRRALRSGELVVVRRGVVVGAGRLAAAVDAPSRHRLATQVAMAATPGPPTVACLGSAASVHGLARLGRAPERVRLYRSRGSAWRDDHVAVLVCGLPDDHVEVRAGVATTTAARTVVDIGRWVSFRGGVVVADSALQLGVARPAIEHVARDCSRWPGIRKAREVLAFADARAASPLESISRVAFHERQLPTPQLQVPLVFDNTGTPVTIVDFFWEQFGVIGEADGLLKYDDEEKPLSLRAEKLRQEELEALGFVVVRWTWDDIWRRPEWVVGRLQRAFERRMQAA